MARILRATGLALAAGVMVLAAGVAEAKPRLTGEQQLAKMLEGRVAGEPVNCINNPTISSARVIDKTAIVYDSGNTLYVQRPRTGVESLDDDAILVTRLYGSQLCSVDTVQLVDRVSGFWRGFVGLDTFVPYTKVKVAAAK
ncbi:hypothetical protein [Novosphingobium huizhouense]|uniref:hypothetical protein n=1 Tax=Novosphingobium huizhouense TaxID=2866625 RepID=UPI001CD846B1|nr:hypothetical protein [Novosphingobium huizhouense]